MDIITIDVNNDPENPTFIITGNLEQLVKNKRLKLSLKRLQYTVLNGKIIIPYRKEEQVKILQDLQRIFHKFGYNEQLSGNTQTELGSFHREEKLFEDFSQKAESIRNNEFERYPELSEKLIEFKKSISLNLKRKLYPLQELSAFHMAFAQNSCNFAVPGAGKTSIVYGAYCYLKNLPSNDQKHVDKLLVVGPISSFAPWENEYFECYGFPVRSFRMSGDINTNRDEKLEHLYSPNPAELTLIFHGGVDSFQSDIIDFLKRNKTMVVVDEAHRIKNPEGVWGRSVTEISKEAVARVILTGTPVPNGYQDIFNLFRFIYPFKFNEILNFHYHNLEDMTINSHSESSRVQQLKSNIAPYFIRIKKVDLKLPPIKEFYISVDMESYQREIYDFIESRYIEDFKENSFGTVKDVLNRAKLIRLRQASTNPALLAKTLEDSLQNDIINGEFDPNSVFTSETEEFISDSEFFNKICNYSEMETPKKFKEILKLLKDEILIDNGKVIIWTIFIQNAKELQQYLIENGIISNLLIGEIVQQDREITIEKFNNPENLEFQVVIANPFSVAESISLHKGCHNAIYLERDYNCSNFLQSKDRIHRVGLKDNQVTKYYYFLSKDSIDEVIESRLRIKIERMEEIINDDIPLFSRIDDTDESEIISGLISNYAQRT